MFYALMMFDVKNHEPETNNYLTPTVIVKVSQVTQNVSGGGMFNPKRAGGGGIRPSLDIFCYISAGCYFFALKLHNFFSSSLALDLRPFFFFKSDLGL